MTDKKYGGYRNLKSFQVTTIIYDLTVEFCRSYLNRSDPSNQSYRSSDQMIQAARSGRQNIAEGSRMSAISKKMEIKLIGVARASLEELLNDCQDFLRQHGLKLWDKDDPRAKEIRALCYQSDTSYQSYRTYLSDPEGAANTLLCLIHQANYLLDRQLQSLEKAFIEEGGYSENLLKRRLAKRNETY